MGLGLYEVHEVRENEEALTVCMCSGVFRDE